MKTKKTVFFAFIMGFGFVCAGAQQTQKDGISVKKNMVNVQFGLTTLTLSDEFRLAPAWALRAELGTNIYNDYSNLVYRYSVSLQPRFYHNYIKRTENKKNTKNNAADFLYSKIQVYPSSVLYNELSTKQAFTSTILLGYGIRRNISGGLHTELGMAAGVRYDYYATPRQINTFVINKSMFDLDTDIMLRIGYSF